MSENAETKEAFSLNEIRTDGGTQARAGLDESKVAEYQLMLEDEKANINTAWPFKDAIELFYDGTDYWLADGFHRIEACRRAMWLWRIHANIHQGTRRDAVLFACGANAAHGLPRTADDKRRAVETLLRDEEWGTWSDREIARRCKVSHPFVAKLRQELTGNVSSEERTYITRHGTTAVMNTAAIGSPKPVQKPLMPELACEWLKAYTDHKGRTWRDLEDNQIHHANSPCYQAFVKEFPNLTDPKLYLKQAMYRLRRENPPKQAVTQHELEIYVRGFVELRGGNRPDWRGYAWSIRHRRNHVIFDQLNQHLARYEYTDAMLDEALDAIIYQEEEYWRSVKEKQAARARGDIVPIQKQTAVPAEPEATYSYTSELEQHIAAAETAVLNSEQTAVSDELQSAADLLVRVQRDIEKLIIQTKSAKVAALCAKAANTISHLVADLKAVDKK